MVRWMVVLLLCLSSRAWALGMETVGNEPISDANYGDWPLVMPVINDEHRVFHVWVNGNEFFYFRGDTAALNAALENFARVQADKLTVVLRPGPGSARNLGRDREYPYQWNLQLIGGIARSMTTRDQGSNVWPATPVMSIYVDDTIDLKTLRIPDNLEVLEIADLQERYAQALKSTDQTVRGWTCGKIAGLDRFDADAMSRVAAMLDDSVDWVRLNAAGALTVYGSIATPAIARLESITTDDASLRERIASTVDAIKAAKPDETAVQEQGHRRRAIHEFVAGRRATMR